MVSMLKTGRLRRFAAGGLAGAVLLAVLPAGAAAQESTSEPLAMELAELMSGAQLDAVAGVLYQAVGELAVRAAVERLQEQDVHRTQCTLQPPSMVSAAPVT